MLIVIFCTSLLTFIVLVITLAFYLIKLLGDESDDNLGDSLVINSSDFNTSPSISPAGLYECDPITRRLNATPNSMTRCENPDHHHECHSSRRNIAHVSDERATTLNLHAGAEGTLRNENGNSSLPSEDASFALDSEVSVKDDTNEDNLTQQHWTAAKALKTQKTLLMNHLGSASSKQMLDDFDSKEMQLGGTGLHWCTTRKSLDKLITLGIPLGVVNQRRETALHVAVRRRKLQVLIGLLSYGAEVDSRNENGETALILAAKCSDIFASQLLLVFDANPAAKDNNGLSARHYVSALCEKRKTLKSQQSQPQQPSSCHLILAMLNEMGAKRCAPKSVNSSSSGNSNNKLKCYDGCSHSGSYNGNSFNKWPSYNHESFYKRHMFMDIISKLQQAKEEKLNSQDSSDESSKENEVKVSRLLCFDGGGMRAVIICQILIELGKYLKRSVIDYFDWIGGTSAGAFVACALCTGTSLQQLRRVSFDVKDEVFCGNKPYNAKYLERVLKRTFGSSTRMSTVADKKLAVTTVLANRDPCQLRIFRNYKSPADVLESLGFPAEKFNNLSSHSIVSKRQTTTRTTLKTLGGQPNNSASLGLHKSTATFKGIAPESRSLKSSDSTMSSSLRDSLGNAHTSTAIATANSNGNSTIEQVIEEDEEDPIMWQAVRASAAAPFFFKPYGPYLDGGIISNNPTLDLLTEFFNYERVKQFVGTRFKPQVGNHLTTKETAFSENLIKFIEEPTSKLSMVVSLGTGRGRVIGRQAMIDFGQVASGFSTVFSPVELVRSIRAARDLFRKLIQQSCQTEDYILDRAQAWCSSLKIPYFRMNPPLAAIFSIDDKRDEQLINALWQTKLYMRAMKPQLLELAELLDGSNKRVELD